MSDEPVPERKEREVDAHDTDAGDSRDTGPAAVFGKIERTIASRVIQSGSAHHPVFDKFEPEHVSQFLEHSRESRKDKERYRRGGRWFNLVYVLILVVVFIFLTIYLLPEHRDIYLEILTAIAAFGAGFAGGYGFKAWREQRGS